MNKKIYVDAMVFLNPYNRLMYQHLPTEVSNVFTAKAFLEAMI